MLIKYPVKRKNIAQVGTVIKVASTGMISGSKGYTYALLSIPYTCGSQFLSPPASSTHLKVPPITLGSAASTCIANEN